jgi:ATP-dependent RNA helicase DDX46/PRP5
VKTGKAKVASSGFGGKGLDKLDQERDAKQKEERKAYGEDADAQEKPAATGLEEEGPVAAAATAAAAPGTKAAEEDAMTFGKFKVEVKRGRPPDAVGGTSVADAARMVRVNKLKSDEAALKQSMKDAEAIAVKHGRNTAQYKEAQNVVAKLNAQIRAARLMLQQGPGGPEDLRKRLADESSEFYAIVPINDYPQKARWKVTNKETMSQV